MRKVMPLTGTEILLAAAQAKRYPPGYGGNWGWGPLVEWEPGDRPPDGATVREYGGPALHVIAGRDAWQREEAEAVFNLVADAVEDHNYVDLLEENPRAVAARLLQAARRQEE